MASGGAGGRLLVSGSRHRIAKSFPDRSWFHSWFLHSCFHRYPTADTVLAVALFEIRPYLAFANFVACYGLGLQSINTSLLWASPVPGTSTNQHLTVSVAVATYH